MVYRGRMPLSVRDVLSLDAVRAGQPVVVAAADRLDATVRWVHAAELTDVGRLLRGGELVLSTGIALPSSGSGLTEYIASLAGAGVAGLAIELGQRYTGALPAPLVSAAEARGLPLIAFQREVPFVEITEAVHARIIDDQMADLLSAQRAHEVFTALSVDGAAAEEIVAAAASLAGRPMLLADLSYGILATAGPVGGYAGSSPRETAGAAVVPDDFAALARTACEGRPRTFYAEADGWLVTMVGARGEDWGRLFLACSEPPGPEDTALLERAATTLALGRLLTRQAESVERQAHRTLLSAIIEDADPATATARARAMGVPVTGRQLVALVARIPDVEANLPAAALPAAALPAAALPAPGLSAPGLSAPGLSAPGLSAQAIVDGIAEVLAGSCREARVPALVSSLDDVRVGALLSLPAQADTDPVLRQVCARLASATNPSQPGAVAPVIGVGSPAAVMADVRRSFLDAREVADVALRQPGRDRPPEDRPYYRLPDLRLRGLLHMLRDDARLAAFADREIGPLLAYDAAHGTRLARDLMNYLEAGGNKAAAAGRAHLARPTFYQRLQVIEHVLGVTLNSPESRTSLHVALLALGPSDEG
jgi:PucR family transcriptional regulator, purine catabolism regulatory protein